MANIIPPMLIELQLETAKIQSQMQQINGKFDDFGKTVVKQGSFLEKFKATASGVFAGNLLANGLNAIQTAMVGAIKDAQEYEVLLNKTAAVIKSTGNAAGLSVQGLQQQASALEKVSLMDENVILNGQNVIATFTQIRNAAGEGNDIFNQTTQAALDLSSALSQDMQSSAIQLGKALNDPVRGVTALQRVGVTFDAQQKQLIKTLMNSGDVLGAQKIILAEVNREFGGAAAAAGDTFAGAVFRAKDKVSDFARDLVTKLQPILLTIGKTIGDLYNKFLAPLLSMVNKNKEALVAFAAIILTAVAAFKTYNVILAITKTLQTGYAVAQVLMSGGQLASIASTNGLAASMLRLNAVMRANPIGLIVTGIALLAAGFVLAWNNSETFRKIVIKGLQIVLNGVGYLVGGFATLIGTFAKIPGMGWAKGIAEGASNAANKIRDVSNGLDSLANKKISIPGFGGGKTKPDGTPASGADAPTTVTADNIKAAKAAAKELEKAAKDKAKAIEKAAKEHAKELEKQNKIVQDLYEKMNNVIADAKEKRVKLEVEYNKKVASINQDYAERQLAIIKDYADKANQIEQDAQNKRFSIIQKSKDLLINAFQNATKIDLASLMKDSDGSGATMVERLKAKYAKIVELQRKAGELASKGFSQTFIQDVISQGPDAGNAMADSILSAAPETVKEMQSLYGKIQDVSENGMNKLADQLYAGMGLANQALKDEYEQVAVDLRIALQKNSEALAETLAKNQKDLQDALLAAQTAYNEAIDALEKDTMDKLVALQDELRQVAQTIKELAGAKAAAAALANSPAAPKMLTPYKDDLNFRNATTGNATYFTSNITGVNLANPQATADAMANGFRFGQSQAIATKTEYVDNFRIREMMK